MIEKNCYVHVPKILYVIPVVPMIKDLVVITGSVKFFHYSLIIKANLKFDFS